jgi:hypothetical protein
VKPEPIEETADRPLTSAMTYAPENEDEAPAQRILRQEPRVQMIKPLIVRDRAAAEAAAPVLDEEAPAPVAIDEEAPAPLVETETAALAPDPEPVAENLDAPIPEDNIPELAALPNETPALPLDQEAASSVPAPVREALKSRFDTAYGSPNRIDLLAPVRQTRHFDPSRFDIFNDPSGG